jgi:hypothetical protein
MRFKRPIINWKRIDKMYNLDNNAQLIELGLDPQAYLKRADRYAHYEDCNWAIIEFGSTLHKAVEQLESITKQLLNTP